MGRGYRPQETWDRAEEERAVCDFSDFNSDGAKECHGWGKERDVG